MDALSRIVKELLTQTNHQDEMTDEDIEDESTIITKWVDWSGGSDKKMSDSGHSTCELQAETTWTGQVEYGRIDMPNLNYILINKTIDEAYLIDLPQWGEEGHSPEFENDEVYKMIEQPPCIYPEYSLSEWAFYEVTTSDKCDTSEEELPAFNKYINWNHCDFL
ncbi:34620_t:CDS:2 [Gigaspora margarita]|uniref:34620_t:CDS:1 n=1 Tax=Gigaspora margarita TaxID=4874 RepID=A0ABN7UL49_GIGMA|nr:34620_t:CDS:2 [Gigaspora margarita]